ncbi:MAG: hypothetical protein IPH61_01655 [Bacteroidetes bacterium]|nr:hypothetical protein [Bacteroidota bacterium]
MIKIIFQNIDLYKKINSIPVLKDFVFLDTRKLAQVKEEALFFKAINQIRMKNGIYKTTKVGRFSDIDTELVLQLNTNTIYEVHDVAVSDGITSVDLFKTFESYNIKSSISISDKFATIYCEPKWYGATYKDAEGVVLFNDFLKILAYRSTSIKFLISKALGYLFPSKSSIKSTDMEILMLNPSTVKLIKEGEITFLPPYDILRLCQEIKNMIL